jgi:cation:H+ antiporter
MRHLHCCEAGIHRHAAAFQTGLDMLEVPHLFQTIQPYFSNPFVLLAGFAAASFLMIWRLHAIEGKGFEGTILGTLIMPYCSGFANLVFVFVMSRTNGNGRQVIENSLVNNVTNLTLILGLTALFYAASAATGAKKKGKSQLDQTRLLRLDLLLTLVAMFLFTGALWALAKDGVLDFYDGLVLVGLFMFWQVLHVFEVLKNNVRKSQSIHWSIVFDLLIIGVCAYAIYLSVDYLVQWVTTVKGAYVNPANLGWLSGAIMVVPNALLALYYAHAGRHDIVVSSQVGDGHICIPMCVGLFALMENIAVPDFFQWGIWIILAAGALHFVSIAIWGRLPRIVGALLLGGYCMFLYKGLGS